MVAANGRIFYKLFQHPSMAIVKGAGMIMKAIIEEGTPELSSRMQELALSEGALPRHLYSSLFTQSIDARMLTMRQLSRSLVALWCTSNPIAIELIKRILPSGLCQYLSSIEQAPKDRDLSNIRDNLKLAIEHTNEQNQSTKMQIINRSRKIQRQILNAQSVKLIEKQLSNVMQHWKQRVGTVTQTTKAEVKQICIFIL
jgi:DnaJ family protein C protein 13